MPIPTLSKQGSKKAQAPPPDRPNANAKEKSDETSNTSQIPRTTGSGSNNPPVSRQVLPQPRHSRLPSAVTATSVKDIRIPTTHGSNPAKAQSGLTPGLRIPTETSTRTLWDGTTKTENPIPNSSIPRSGHTRSKSEAKPTSIVSKTVPASKIIPTATLKPSFNTYQQHYTPKKPQHVADTKPQATNVNNAKPTATAGTTSLEIRRLQNELLQLSLVYQNSSKTLAEYRQSARRQLDAKAKKLNDEYKRISALEQIQQEKLNASAVVSWFETNENDTISGPERFQILSNCVREISDLSLTDGPYEHAMQTFDKWLDENATTIQEQRQNQATAAAVIHPLNEQWSNDISDCKQRLEACKTLLKLLGDAPEQNTGLGIILSRHRDLVDCMLQQVISCETSYAQIMRTQQEWITDSLEKIIDEVNSETQELQQGNDNKQTPRLGIWELSDPG